ncbi:MAG: TerB family tellurite resistance protein [Paludibacteraceae bacterium]|nr:TerB family tellurite resistance protein [Paludibacteraceae bacterium]
MKTNIKDIANILAAAIWADGVYDEAEEIALYEIQDALELDKAEFEKEMEAALDRFEDASEDQANEILQASADAVDDNEVGIVYEAAMQVVLADGVLKHDEVETLLVISDMLGIADADAVLLLADMLKSDEDVTVEVD